MGDPSPGACRRTMLVLAVALAGLVPAAGQPPQPGQVTGSIREPGGEPLPGVTVRLSGPAVREPLTAVTAEDGTFRFATVPEGRFEMTCDAPGFLPWRIDLIVTTGEARTVDVTMRPDVQTSAPVVEPLPPPVLQPPTVQPGPRPPPVEAPQPPAVAEPPPAHDLLAEVDKYLSQLDLGSIAFNAPDEMLIGDTVQMRLLLSPTVSVEDLQEQLGDLAGTPQGATIRIAPEMEAVLTGQNFQITAITPGRQRIARNEPTEWRWEVSPRAAGAHRLHLVLNATVLDSSRTLRTFDQTILVNVAWSQRITMFVGSNWQWLWTTALVPLAGWWWRRRSRPREAT